MSVILYILAILVVLVIAFIVYGHIKEKIDTRKYLEQIEKKKRDIKEFQDKYCFEVPCPDKSLEEYNTFVYVENGYNEAINKYIQSHYTDIVLSLERRSSKFIYINKDIKNLLSSDYARYLSPNLSHRGDSPMSVLVKLYGLDKDKVSPSIIYYDYSSDTNRNVIKGCKIGGQTPEEIDYFFKCFFWYLKQTFVPNEVRFSIVEKDRPGKATPKIKGGEESNVRSRGTETPNIRFSIDESKLDANRPTSTSDPGTKHSLVSIKFSELDFDDTLSNEDITLLEEIKDKLSSLRKKGITEAFLQRYLVPEEKISRISVSKEGRISLVDFDDMEIKMTPLPKSLYILFLKHPEGIRLKCMVEHKQELTKIYEIVKGGMPTDAKLKSIERLTDPFDNSINEKLSNIREAFECCVNPGLASHYIVAGPLGEAKNIKLPVDLRILQL